MRQTKRPGFSSEIEDLANREKVSLLSVAAQFGPRGFAVLALLLMAVPALPLPTGGITHIFELITMLLALEMMAGRRSVWLPQRWFSRKLPTSGLAKLVKLVRRIENFSRPRSPGLMTNSLASRLIGLVFLVFSLFAFSAPPFSGLDTLPSLGVVLIALAVLLEDVVVALAGLIIGCVGIALVVTLGSLVFKLF